MPVRPEVRSRQGWLRGAAVYVRYARGFCGARRPRVRACAGIFQRNMTRPASAGALTGDRFPLASEATGVSGLAERYAAALFDLADERHALDAVAADLRELRAMLHAERRPDPAAAQPGLVARGAGQGDRRAGRSGRADAIDARFPRRRRAQPAAVRGAGDDRGVSAAARRAPRRGHRTGHCRNSRSTTHGARR